MAKRIWYDRRDIGGSDTEVQFFAQSQAAATGAKNATNMERDAELPRAFAVERIGIRFPINDSQADDSYSGGLLADWQELLDGAVVEIEVAQGVDIILPVSEMLMPRSVGMVSAGFAELVHNGISNYVEELACQAGPGGVAVDFAIPEKTMFTVVLRLESALSAAMAHVKVLMFGDEAAT